MNIIITCSYVIFVMFPYCVVWFLCTFAMFYIMVIIWFILCNCSLPSMHILMNLLKCFSRYKGTCFSMEFAFGFIIAFSRFVASKLAYNTIKGTYLGLNIAILYCFLMGYPHRCKMRCIFAIYVLWKFFRSNHAKEVLPKFSVILGVRKFLTL